MNTEYINKVLHGDCLEWLPKIDNKSIDLILTDLPYGTTEAKWDKLIPIKTLWEQYERVLKENGTIVLTAAQPFTSLLITSNLKMFKYVWVWDKRNATGHLNAKARPLKQHEDIVVFSRGSATSTNKTMIYNPQGLTECSVLKTNSETGTTGNRKSREKGSTWEQKQTGYPKSIISFTYDKEKFHPTQKPTALFEYLIKTYTDEGMTVLDNCAGSGTTAVAAINTGRNYILIEKEWDYCMVANERIEEAKRTNMIKSSF